MFVEMDKNKFGELDISNIKDPIPKPHTSIIRTTKFRN